MLFTQEKVPFWKLPIIISKTPTALGEDIPSEIVITTEFHTK